MNIKEKLIGNEMLLLKKFPKYSTSIDLYISKLKQLTVDGDFYNFVLASGKNKIDQYVDYSIHGYKSSVKIIAENLDNLDLDKCTKPDILIKGNLYNSMIISALAKNFNVQTGMYYNKEDNIIVLKSEIGGTSFNDHWVIKDGTFHYFFQKEKNTDNYRTKRFKILVNLKTYENSIGLNNSKVHFFCRYKDDFEYVYKGIVKPQELVSDNKAIILKLI